MIPIKSPKDLEIMAEGSGILAQVMKELTERVVPGITTEELDRLAESLILDFGGKPSFKGYEGYPAALCASVNEQIVHAVPSDRKLEEGDILSLDLGVFYRGFHADMAVTVPVGEISPEARRLIRATKKALKRGIKKSRPGNTFGDVSNTIERHIKSQGFGVIRELCGHGIGRELHQEPQILNYGKRGEGPKIKPRMCFCLEPMLSAGNWRIKKSEDGYGYETEDGSLSAHFEHTLAVTEEKCLVLTRIK
ncbi:MAG: type I methionyl aminopeptidase [Candidatus Nealsonbacteria bacterium]|nr:type I methionyl aminopeptidase [Candidatus Nealsonbacteria bacterium]